MQMRAPLLVALLALPALAGCLAGDAPAGLLSGGGLVDPLRFSTPLDLPDSSDASEPFIAIDRQGAIYVSAPRGVGTSSPLWKSTDGGATWTRMMPNPEAGGAALGGGDTSIALGPKDEIYVTDLWAGSSSVSVSEDGGRTWFTSPVASPVPYHDREWNAVDGKGVAYYLARTFSPGVAAWVSRSADHGRTWTHAGNPWVAEGTGDRHQNGAFVVNPKTDALGVVHVCRDGTVVCVSTSADGAATWTSAVVAKAPGSVANVFPALAADTAGNWYVAYAARQGDSTQVFLSTSADGKQWSPPAQVTSGPGNRLFPWMVAGDAGRIAIAWYGTNAVGDSNDEAAMKDAAWDVMLAQSLDALAPAPHFAIARVTPAPIHTGTVSTQGLTPDGPDRRLGDFFTIALDPQGYVHFATMRTTEKVAVQHIRQTGGDSLYAAATPVTPPPSTPTPSPTPTPTGLLPSVPTPPGIGLP